MKKYLFIIFFYFGISACDSNNDDNSPFVSDDDQTIIEDESSITGLWDRGGHIDGLVEQLYTYIGDNNDFLVYDYQQDDFGNGNNCYTPVCQPEARQT